MLTMLTVNMIYILLAIFSAASAEPSNVYCCKEEQGVLLDNGGVCVRDNVSTPINLSCKSTSQLDGFDFTVTDDGLLFLMIATEEMRLEKNTFCISNETGNSTKRALVLCSDEVDEQEIKNQTVIGYCMLVSSVFLFITAIVYCILPDMRDLQGKSIISLCLSAGIGECILGGMNVTEYSDMNLCAARGFFVYYFLLCGFFWTNAISIQLLVNIRRPTSADYSNKQFSWYALYAYGSPALLSIAMAIVNFLPGRHSKPGIGLNTCWFFNKTQQWYYMYSVMTVLLVANICMFIYISLYLWRGSYTSSNIKSLRYKFTMTVRMIAVMGLSWIFEMISSLILQGHIIWFIIDIFNSLNGLLIFLLLVILRKKVVRELHNRGYLECISGVVERHLAVGDDEEDVVHATDVPFEDKLPYYMTADNRIGNMKQ